MTPATADALMAQFRRTASRTLIPPSTSTPAARLTSAPSSAQLRSTPTVLQGSAGDARSQAGTLLRHRLLGAQNAQIRTAGVLARIVPTAAHIGGTARVIPALNVTQRKDVSDLCVPRRWPPTWRGVVRRRSPSAGRDACRDCERRSRPVARFSLTWRARPMRQERASARRHQAGCGTVWPSTPAKSLD